MFYAGDSQKSYLVESGTVLVFLASFFDNGEIQRKYSLTDVKSGQYIPSAYLDDPDLGRWMIVFSALDDAVITELGFQSPEVINQFAQVIGLRLSAPEEFAAAVVEMINLRIVKDEGFIYASLQEQEKTRSKGLEAIFDFFNKPDKVKNTRNSGSVLYDTLALICDRLKIQIEPFEKVKEAYGRKFSIEDIARLSGFSIREVVFEENWFKHDSGILLAFKDQTPIACVPKGPKKYQAINLEKGISRIVDIDIARTLAPKAYMIYRPLPNKEITGWDLVRFGVADVFKHDIVNILLFSCLATVVGLLLPFLNQVVFDTYIPLANQSVLIQICALILAITLGSFAFTIVKNLSILRFSTTMSYSLQCAIFDRLYNLPNSFFSRYESADLAKRVLGITSIFKLLTESIITSVLSGIFSLLYLFRMFSYSGILAATGLVLVALNMGITVLFGMALTRYDKELMEVKAKISSVLYQIILGIAKIRIAMVENRAVLNYLDSFIKSKKILFKKDSASNLSASLNMFMNTSFSAVFYFLLINASLNVSFGQFFGFISAFSLFSGAMISLVSVYLTANSAIPTYQRAKPILQSLPEYIDDAILPAKNLEGNIEVSNLSFKYRESDEEMVLSDISFKIDKGQYVGIVGTSGSGKSTLLKILLGFEKPTLGKVYFDDKDLDCLDKRELRKRFGVVLQDGQLITGSIFENIAITTSDVTEERVRQVVRMVGLEDDIAQMPMGLHTMISEGAGTISGGQKQRILIARSILNNPDILFFDEATSALDNLNQALVTQSLEQLKVTRLVIAHRLSTVQRCDNIIVLDGGHIVESGGYEDLISKRGVFYNLVVNQMV